MNEDEEKKKKKKKKKKDEEEEEDDDDDSDDNEEEGRVIMEARMHCQACRFKVYKAIISYPGMYTYHIYNCIRKKKQKGKR